MGKDNALKDLMIYHQYKIAQYDELIKSIEKTLINYKRERNEHKTILLDIMRDLVNHSTFDLLDLFQD